MNAYDALNITFVDPKSGDSLTIRNYFKRFLHTLFEEGESFSGKRPFGNSGWEGDLEIPLVEAGCISGKIEYLVFDEAKARYIQITKEEYTMLADEMIENGDAHRNVVDVSQIEYEGFIQQMIGTL